MDESTPPQLPPPFDWSRYAAQQGHVAPSGTPPVGPPTFGAPPSPTAPLPPSPRGQGDGGRRRHPARRTRIAAAVVSGAAFVGLVGCTALTAVDEDDGPITPDSTGTAPGSATPPEQNRSASPDSSDRYGQDQYGSDQYGDDRYGGSYGQVDPYGGSSQYDPRSGTGQPSSPDWGGSAAPGSGGAASGPSTQSQGS